MALEIIDFKIFLDDNFLGDLYFKSQDTVHSIKIEKLYEDEFFHLMSSRIIHYQHDRLLIV